MSAAQPQGPCGFHLALVGIVASFPLGVLLALGRRSNLPVLKGLCVLFIELVRGVPLVSLLFMAQVIVPLFLPEDLRVDRVMRALFAITLFSSAYMAENVRGGLQSVPQGRWKPHGPWGWAALIPCCSSCFLRR